MFLIHSNPGFGQDGGTFDCGLVAIQVGNIFNCQSGGSAQVQVSITICSPGASGNWTVSHPDANNSFSFYVQPNCPAPFNCGTSGQTLDFGTNYDCNSFDPLTIIVTDANGNGPCVFFNAESCNDIFVLPVEMINFSAQVINKDVGLQWTTASESNSDYFDVEYSYDGIEFTAIDRLKAVGNSHTATNYSYRHSNILLNAFGPLYYRLRQVDLDGSEEISDIVSVVPKKVQTVVSPNLLALGQAFRICSSETIENIKIVNSIGHTIISIDDINQGRHIDCYEMMSPSVTGLYYVVINGKQIRQLQVI